MERHTITIAPNGSTKIKVEGVKGKGCMEATREIEEALGEVTSKTKTREYNEQPQRIQNINRAKR